jgi:putative peptide zinc metalloprotease protein
LKSWNVRPPCTGPKRSLIVAALGLLLLVVAIEGHGPSTLRAQTTGTATALATPTAAAPVSGTPTATGTAPATTPAASPQATATPASSAAGEDDLPPVTSTEETAGASPQNRIVAKNRSDNRLRVRAKVQLNHIPGDSASPSNYAEGYSSCDGCQTFAVALQIDLISRDASQITPENVALALNYKCNGCHTIVRASQYVIQVDDPTQVPDRVRDLVGEMNRQLNQVASDHSVTDVGQAEAVLNGVIAQFQDLGQSLSDQRDETVDPTTPGASASP